MQSKICELTNRYSIQKYMDKTNRLLRVVCSFADLSASSDDDGLGGSTRGGSEGFDLLNNILSLGNESENSVSSIEPAGVSCGDEELRAIGVRTSVGHREAEGFVLEGEVLISELAAIN